MTYHYDHAIILRIHDGDTIFVDLDMGMGLWRRGLGVRFAGINAPEIGTPDGSGVAALAFLQTLIKAGDTVSLDVLGIDNYGGRVDARVYGADKAKSLGRLMLENGQAVPLGPYQA